VPVEALEAEKPHTYLARAHALSAMEHLVRLGNLLVDLNKRFSEPVDILLKACTPVVRAVGLFGVD
ncbi:hypothetical protein QMN58_27325, partial [Escherichia coli]|nr:hypothetical protein [Escherichia coli]